MPHLAIQHSDNLAANEMQDFCHKMHDAMVACGIFPLAGIRVRAIACSVYAIADLHQENAFVDMALRIGQGRTPDEKKTAGERLMAAAEAAFADRLQKPHFALSLEICEIDSALSWKRNSIHPRLKVKS